MEKQQALKHITKIFNDFHIPYALIGAYAVAVWGVPRATHDIDFIADIPNDKMQEIIKTIQSCGLKTEVNTGDSDDPINSAIRVTYTDTNFEETIDILLGIKGISKEIFKRTSIFSVFNSNLPVISPEDLIISKLIAGNPIDIEDAKSVLGVMKDKIDLDYIKNFCNKNKIKLPL